MLKNKFIIEELENGNFIVYRYHKKSFLGFDFYVREYYRNTRNHIYECCKRHAENICKDLNEEEVRLYRTPLWDCFVYTDKN